MMSCAPVEEDGIYDKMYEALAAMCEHEGIGTPALIHVDWSDATRTAENTLGAPDFGEAWSTCAGT